MCSLLRAPVPSQILPDPVRRVDILYNQLLSSRRPLKPPSVQSIAAPGILPKRPVSRT